MHFHGNSHVSEPRVWVKRIFFVRAHARVTILTPSRRSTSCQRVNSGLDPPNLVVLAKETPASQPGAPVSSRRTGPLDRVQGRAAQGRAAGCSWKHCPAAVLGEHLQLLSRFPRTPQRHPHLPPWGRSSVPDQRRQTPGAGQACQA
jgi:hypothetical protein